MRVRFLALVVLAAGVLLAGPAAAASAASAADRPTDVNDFDFSSWDARFEVGIDDEGRSTLHAEETRVAEFPEFDQNRGIVAGYPERYQGADLGTTIISVRDENGDSVPFETEEEDDMLLVLTGTDDYVHGSTTYVIEYEMRDVVLAAEKTGVDEFYWNLLPLNSTQNIDSFRAEVVFDDDLASHLTGAASCYQGRQGATDACELSADAGVFDVEGQSLTAGEGVTVAIALEPGTVTQPSARQPNAATDVLPYALGGGTALLSLGGWWATSAMIRSRRRGTGIVVAQYDVPDDMPPLLASTIIPKAKNPLSAEIIHLAVRGMLRLEEIPEAGKKNRPPHLRRLDAPVPDPLDAQTLEALFADKGSDAVITMPKNSQSFAGRIQKLLKSASKEARQRGHTTEERSRPARIIQTFALIAFAGMVGLLIWAMATGRDAAGPVFFVTLMCGVLLLISSIAVFSKHTVLTRKGALQLEYLEGVREFIRVAEADRLRMLQSYTGAERRSDGTVDTIHVYERLLPYAILFDQEREWGSVLEHAYGQAEQNPGWINGTGYGIGTRVALLSSAARTSSTYTAPGSSSAGGSSGGGFSGGGGGGGFSGGR